MLPRRRKDRAEVRPAEHSPLAPFHHAATSLRRCGKYPFCLRGTNIAVYNDLNALRIHGPFTFRG